MGHPSVSSRNQKSSSNSKNLRSRIDNRDERVPRHRNISNRKSPNRRPPRLERRLNVPNRPRSRSRGGERRHLSHSGRDSRDIPPLLDQETQKFLRRAMWRKNKARQLRLQNTRENSGRPAFSGGNRAPVAGGRRGVTRGMRMDDYAPPKNGKSMPRKNDIDHTVAKARREASTRTKDVFWTRKLLEAESSHPNRWAHSGFKEMYRDELGFPASENKEKERRSKSFSPTAKNFNSKDQSGRRRPSPDRKRRRSSVEHSRPSKLRRSGSQNRPQNASLQPSRGRSPLKKGQVISPKSNRTGRNDQQTPQNGKQKRRSMDRRSSHRSSSISSSSVTTITSRSGSRSSSRSFSGSVSSYSSYSRSSYTSSSFSSSSSRTRSSRSYANKSGSSVFSVSPPPPNSAAPTKTPPKNVNPASSSHSIKKANRGQKIVDAAQSAAKIRMHNIANANKKLRVVKPAEKISYDECEVQLMSNKEHTSPNSARPPPRIAKEEVVEKVRNKSPLDKQNNLERITLKTDMIRTHGHDERLIISPVREILPISDLQLGRNHHSSPPPPHPTNTTTKILSEGEHTGSDSSSDEDDEGPRKMTLSERFGKLAQLSSQRQEYDGIRMKIVREGGQDKKVYLEGAPRSPSPPILRSSSGAHERWLREHKAEYDEYESRYGEFRQWDPHRDLPTTLPPNWEDVKVRYRYYKESGYFGDRSITMDDYLKWEEWWYRYRDWLEKYGDMEDRISHVHRQVEKPPPIEYNRRRSVTREGWIRRPEHRNRGERKRHIRY